MPIERWTAGYLAKPTPDMGPFEVEVRTSSFKLYTVDEDCASTPWLYPNLTARQGAIEMLIADIPALRALLDQVERIASGHKRPDE